VESGQNQGLASNFSENAKNGWQMGGANRGVGKSGGGPPQSKTWRKFGAAPANAKRPGVRQPAGALERGNHSSVAASRQSAANVTGILDGGFLPKAATRKARFLQSRPGLKVRKKWQ
jgi:hypothetical protein